MITVTCSASGAPGTTTTSLGIALTAPAATGRHSLLIEADPAGTTLFGGWLRTGQTFERNLLNVGIAAHGGDPLDRAIVDQTLALDETGAVKGILGLADPAQAATLAGTWPLIGQALAKLDSAGIDVIIDAGRATQGGFALDLVTIADRVVLFTSAAMVSAIRTAPIAAALHSRMSAAGVGERLGLGVIHRGWTRHQEDHHTRTDTYSDVELARHLKIPVIMTIPDDPRGAAVLCHGLPQPKRFGGTSLMKSYHAAAARLRHSHDAKDGAR